ncbi:MAG: DNA repair protein RadA, partial [Propioniciclava sp.]
MARTTTTHRCSECGWTTNRWVGRCGQCQAWGSLAEVSAAPTRTTSLAKPTQAAQRITQVEARHARGISTGIGELDRVLGDGLVPGAVV